MSNPVSLRARKSLGQHWLTDQRILGRIAAASGATDEDTVIEIGAGTGLLTSRLADGAKRLIAVEIDPRAAALLRERFAAAPNVAIVEANVLTVKPEEILAAGGGRLPYVAVGNLPYYIGTAIVRRFLQAAARPRRLVVTLQAEVAEAMAAQPGRMSFLSVQTQVYAQAKVLFKVPAKAFRPPPKVGSAVLALDVCDGPAVEVDRIDAFLSLAQAGFAAPRKHLRNSLAIGLRTQPGEAEAVLAAAGIDPGRRPAELSLDEWRNVYLAYRARPERAG